MPWMCLQSLCVLPSKNQETTINRKHLVLLFKQDDWKSKVFPLFELPRKKSACLARVEHAEDQIHKIGFWDSSTQNHCQLFSRKHKLFHRALKLIQLNITATLNWIKMLKGERHFWWYIYYTDVILLYIFLGHDLRSLEPWKIFQLTSDSFWSSCKVLPPVCKELQNQTILQTKIPSNCSILTSML